MRILFVWPDINSNARYEVNMGICIISSVLKKSGHQALLFHPVHFSENKFLSIVNSYNPDLVGFSVTTHQYQYAINYSKLLKQTSKAPVVFGGVHPTLIPDSVVDNPYVDIICRGEGEFPLLELAEALEKGKDYSSILNLWVKKPDGRIIKNNLRDLIQNLDSLPFADREFINQKKILQNNGFRIDLSISRGCPYQCPFCCNSALSDISKDKGNFVRLRSVDNVLKELEEITNKYHVEEIHFQDDMFLFNKQWLREFADKYPKAYHIPFHISARVEHIDEENIGLLKQGGCISITMGIESGNENLRRTVLQKTVSNQDILKARLLLRNHGIQLCSLNMVGIPEETPEMIKESIDFNKKLDPDWLGVSIFSPYPGTILYQYCKEKGNLKEEDFTHFSPSYLDESSAAILNLPTISQKEIIAGYRKFMDFALKKYIKRKYSILYPFFILVAPILKTPLRGIIIKFGRFLIFDKGIFIYKRFSHHRV